MVKGKGKGPKSQGNNKVLPGDLERSEGSANQVRAPKLGLYHHFRIEEQNLEQLKGKFSELYTRSPDFGCRNLMELLLMSLEMRNYAEKAFDAEFWELDPAEVIDIDTIKNIKSTDIVFKKDKQFRDKLVRFIAEAMRVMIQHVGEPGSEDFLHNCLKWLKFLAKVPVRELRKVATELSLESFGALLRYGAEHVEHRRSNKEKFAEWFPTLISVIYKHYFNDLLGDKIKDIDNSIRSMTLEHVFANYRNGSLHALDEGVSLAVKRNKRNLSREIDEIKQGPLTLHAIHLIFEPLKDGENNPERLLRSLQHVPQIVHDMATNCKDTDHAEWRTEGTQHLKRNIDMLAKHKNLVKRLMDEKDEVGALAIYYFKNLCHFPETSNLLDDKDRSQISVMMTSMKKKVKEAATDFFLSRIGERSKENHTEEQEEQRITQFVELFHEVNTTIAQEITHQEGFDEAAIIQRLESFRHKLNSFLDAKRVCEMFLSSDKTHHELEFNFKGYLGSLLYAMLRVSRLTLMEEGAKSEQEKEILEEVRGMVVSINTRIKEDLKKTLVAKNLKHPELLRLHLRLIESVCGDAEDELYELVLSLYDKSIDLQTLRLNSKVLRMLYERLKKESLIKSEQFSEKISRVFAVQMENLSSTVAKLRKELEKSRNVKLKDDRKLMDELRITLRKATALKENFKTLFQVKDQYLQDAELLMDLYVNESLVDKEMLERVIVLLTTNITLLMSALGTHDGISKFIKYRDTVLEHLLNLLSNKSLPQMPLAEADAARRFGFLHLMETLRIVTADSLNHNSIYLKPEPQMLERVWDFILSYCFRIGEAADTEEGDLRNSQYHASSGEKRIVSGLDEERPVDSPAKIENHSGKGVRLRYSDFNFKEDVQSLIAVAFRNCIHLLKSIGIGFVARLIDHIYQLASDQEYFVRIVEENLLEPLIAEEKKHPLSPNSGVGVMLFTKLVQFCFEHFDLAVMKSFSKSVLSVLKRHLLPDGSDDVLRVNYRAITYKMLVGTLENHNVPYSIEKLMLFLKKGVLGHLFCQRLLYYTLETMNTYKAKDGKEKELDNIDTPKFQHMVRIRTQLLQVCDKQFKEDENAPADPTATKGRRASSKSPAPARQVATIVDENERVGQEGDKENPAPAQTKKNTRKGKAGKIVDESAAEPKSRSSSPQREASPPSKESNPTATNGKKKIVGAKSKAGQKQVAEADKPVQQSPANKGQKSRRTSSLSQSSEKAKKGPAKEVKRGGSKKNKKR